MSDLDRRLYNGLPLAMRPLLIIYWELRDLVRLARWARGVKIPMVDD
jgi:hypothetical protein